jgi:hypothetical protein
MMTSPPNADKRVDVSVGFDSKLSRTHFRSLGLPMVAGFFDDFALQRRVSALRRQRCANADAICI